MMPMQRPGERYDAFARALHWLMAALVIGTIIVAETRGYAPRDSALRRGLGDVHYQIGVGILLIVWVRLAWRLRATRPPITPLPPPWQRTFAHVVAWAFYALMIGLPVLGILAREADGATVSLLSWALPTLIGNDRAVSHQLEAMHEWLGNVMIGLVVVHVMAALYHAWVLRDDALARMLGVHPAHRLAGAATRPQARP